MAKKRKKISLTYFHTHLSVMLDYVDSQNYGFAKELAASIRDDLKKYDWAAFKKWEEAQSQLPTTKVVGL